MFSFPLKFLGKLCGAPYLFLLVLSGLISYVNAKVYQGLKCKDKDVNISEFIYIFSLSISLIFFTTIIGYPIIGYILSISEALSIISLKDTFYFLFKCIFKEPLFMTGDVSSDQIYDSDKFKENLEFSKPLLADNANGESGGTSNVNSADVGENSPVPVANSPISAQVAVNNANQVDANFNANQARVFQYFIFDALTDKYIINDPTGIRARGYVNPATGQPYPSSQPYLGNLARALEHYLAHSPSGAIAFNIREFSAEDIDFIYNYMAKEYPNRNRWQYYNSTEVRRRMRNKP